MKELKIPVIKEHIARKFLNNLEFKVYMLMLEKQAKEQ